MNATPTPSRQRPGNPVPLAVWPVAQTPVADQRAGRYLATTIDTTELTPPALSAHIVTTYSRPGQRVCDVMCGTGTILAEATRAGRVIAGVDLNDPLTRIARVNVAIARLAADGARPTTVPLPGPEEVACGDARTITTLVSRADLVTLHPPGPGTRHAPRGAARPTATDLGTLSGESYWGGITEIAAAARTITAPSGHLVLTVRGYQHGQRHVDSAAAAIAAAQRAGWTYQQHIIALLAPLRGDQIRPPAAHATPTRRPPSRALHQLVHCDVLAFTPGTHDTTDRGAAGDPSEPGASTRQAPESPAGPGDGQERGDGHG